MLAILNLAKDALVKYALPFSCTGTLANIAIGAGPSFALSAFASGVKAVRNAENLWFTPTAGSKTLLQWMSPEALNAYYYDRETAANATPKYWAHAKNDPRTVELHRKPNVAGTLTFTGYGVPLDATDAISGTFPWLNADDERAIVLYAAALLTDKASDDPRVPAMRAILLPDLDATFQAIRNRIPKAVQDAYLDIYIPRGMTATAPGGE